MEKKEEKFTSNITCSMSISYIFAASLTSSKLSVVVTEIISQSFL